MQCFRANGCCVSAEKHRTQFSDLGVYLKSLLLKSGNCSPDYFLREFLRHTMRLPFGGVTPVFIVYPALISQDRSYRLLTKMICNN